MPDLANKPTVWLYDDIMKVKTYFPKANGDPTSHLIDALAFGGPAYEYTKVGLYVPSRQAIEEVYWKSRYWQTAFATVDEFVLKVQT